MKRKNKKSKMSNNRKASRIVKSKDNLKDVSGMELSSSEQEKLEESEHSEEVEKSTETENILESVELKEPGKPEESVESSEPGKSVEPKESKKSEKPVESEELTKQVKPAGSAESIKSDKTAEPVEPEKTLESGKAIEKEGIAEPGESVGQEQSEEQSSKTVEQKKNKWKKYTLIAVGTVAGTLLIVYASGVIYFKERFLGRTLINGIDASYCTIQEADDFIAKKLSKYKITLVERGGTKEVIRARQMDYRYVPGDEVEILQHKQNIFAWPVSIWQEKELYFDSATTYSAEKLEESLKELRCFNRKVEKAPKDAYMEFYDTSYRLMKEEEGKKVNFDKLYEAITNAVINSKTEIDLEKMNCYERPNITENDEILNRLVKNLNQYTRTKITYQFGGNTEVLDGVMIKDWLSFDEDANVKLDESQISAYIAGLAEKYDTYNKPRSFRTNDGSYVEVEGGHYGWKIDQEMEFYELLELIRQGMTSERTANFAQTAVSWENSDLGGSYVEIDLSRQHLWMYIDGRVIVSSDFVSGDLARRSRTTPPGTFLLYYKKSPAVLRSTTPGDSYESPVRYWMPFNGGIGLHDANWRGSFGGNIYTYNGSHGCINLPTDAARTIYENIYTGFPIICFYR